MFRPAIAALLTLLAAPVLAQTVPPGPRIALTAVTQPLLVASALLAWDQLRLDVTIPDDAVVAGHSVGELAAAAHAAVGDDRHVAAALIEVVVARRGDVGDRGDLRHANAEDVSRRARSSWPDAHEDRGGQHEARAVQHGLAEAESHIGVPRREQRDQRRPDEEHADGRAERSHGCGRRP